jgi:hypothetical protein
MLLLFVIGHRSYLTKDLLVMIDIMMLRNGTRKTVPVPVVERLHRTVTSLFIRGAWRVGACQSNTRESEFQKRRRNMFYCTVCLYTSRKFQTTHPNLDESWNDLYMPHVLFWTHIWINKFESEQFDKDGKPFLEIDTILYSMEFNTLTPSESL